MNPTRPVLRPLLRPVVVVLAAGLIGAACGSGDAGLRIGVNRGSLTLAFAEDEQTDEPVKPDVIYRLIPAPPELIVGPRRFFAPPGLPPLPPVPVARPCPGPPSGAGPKHPVVVKPRGFPAPGVYTYRASGTIKILTGGRTFTLPFPKAIRWTYRDFKATANGGTYEILKEIGSGYARLEQWQHDRDQLQLVSRTTKTQAGDDVFKPLAPVTFARFRGEGDGANGAGADDDALIAMVVTGRLVTRATVAACEEVVDAFANAYMERRVNLNDGTISGNHDNKDPSIMYLATQFGALVVGERQFYQEQIVDSRGASALVTFNYRSMIDRTDPAPAK